ncbi:ABC transporter permease [Ferruginibacter sp. SUN106]|uniref:ABC transporter permease n=1 Tax=Ferruginibacter sp. SUN106 TaxID=2978348 RepID=UPI003D36B2D7
MIRNYFRIAWRNLIKNKSISLINICGLAVGMAVATLIGLWIWDELSFDRYNKNYESIAQIARKETVNGEAFISENSNHFPIPLAGELRNYNNYFKQVALASESSQQMISFKENQFSAQGMYVEPGFLEIFTLKLLAGTSAGFTDPNTILLTKSLAISLFGNENPAGKILKLGNTIPVKVAGIFEDLPDNSRFHNISFFCPWDLLVNTNNGVKNDLNNWVNSSFNIFVQTVPGKSMQDASNSIKEIYWNKIKNDRPQSPGDNVALFLHPMKDWHLRSEWKNGVQAGGQIQLVWLFGLIGVFVLLLACINFMNLSTARSEKRAKEVGIRKTVGSLRSQLVKQFLSESLLIVSIAFIIGVGLVLLSLNWFNEIADKKISYPFYSSVFWIISIMFIAITAFISGSYPALYLSSFRPVKVLKGTFRAGRSAAIPRRVMVALQFTVSIILIIGTIVVYRQVQHAQNRPIGYNRDGLIRFTMNTTDLTGKNDVLRQELLASGGVIEVAASSAATTENNYFDDRIEWEGKDPKLAKMAFVLRAVTYEFGKTVGWQFTQGRDFSRSFPTDKGAVILNEAAVKYMRLAEPVDKTITFNNKKFNVVGVIKDMITESPYKPVQQSIFFMVPQIGPVITMRLNPKLSTAKAVSLIQPVFKRLNPSGLFDYKFVDEEYGRKFAAEQRIGTLSTVFAILAIFISCMGIFGLASFVAAQRIKEIGVRKILGASVMNLWGLLSKEFVLLVILAFVIAIPIAYYFMDQWLQKYEYRTNISWWVFAIAGAFALFITLLTVSFQAIKAAIANPVKSLRTE